MSFKTLNIGNTALVASQLALNTTGHNISNAGTEGYARQRVQLEAVLPDVKSYGVIGGGSQVQGVNHVVDDFLERQLTETKTLRDYLNTKRESFVSLETVFNELTDNDISSAMDGFWNSVSDFVNNSADISTRRSMIEQASALCDTVRNTDAKLDDMRVRMDGNIVDTVNNVNVLIDEIAALNNQIVSTEQGGLNGLVANDLRDKRMVVARELANKIDATITEADNGQFVVSVKGRMLVFEQNVYHLDTEQVASGDMLVHAVVFEKDRDTVDLAKSELGAMVEIRDQDILSYKNELDELSATFMWEFNQQHNQGQGLEGFSALTTTVQVLNPSSPLNQIQRTFTPYPGTYEVTNGNFELLVRNATNNQVSTINIEIDLDGNQSDPDTILTPTDTPAIQVVTPSSSLDTFNLTIPHSRIGIDTGPEGELYFNIQDLGGGNYQIDAYRTPAIAPGPPPVFNAVDMVATSGVVATGGLSTNIQLNAVAGYQVNGPVRLVAGATSEVIQTQVISGNSLVEKLQTGLDIKFPGVFNVTTDNLNRITIDTNSDQYTFAFGRDTSGVLATLGFNNFFDGFDAGTMKVADTMVDSPERLAAGSSFIDGSNENAVALLEVREKAIFNNSTTTIDDYYQSIIGRLGIESANSEHMLQTQEDLLTRTENQREELSGVNLDEELTLMIQYQRAFQSAAKFISTANSLYEALINM